MRKLLVALLMIGLVAPAWAQDGDQEIIVTAMRRLDPDDDDRRPVPIVATPAPIQMLHRSADFAIQQVVVTSDTTGEDARNAEIRAMTRKAIDLAGAGGVVLATGELVVEPLTVANYGEAAIVDNDEGGGSMVKFLVKVPLAAGVNAKAALARIEQFIKRVPAVGRAEIKAYSELTLSVVNPEQYRVAIIDLVAKDTATTAARFGTGYGVEVSGLDRPVQWRRAGLTEVDLFLPSASTVRPR